MQIEKRIELKLMVGHAKLYTWGDNSGTAEIHYDVYDGTYYRHT